jgi:hypothetical protein
MKVKRIFALLLVLSLVFALCACGSSGPKGSYTATYNGAVVRLEFSGDKITMRFGVGSPYEQVSYGTFTRTDNNVHCDFEGGGVDDFVYDPKADTLDWNGILLFVKDR